MKPNITTTIVTYALLGLAGVVAVSLPDSLPTTYAVTPADPDVIEINGTVRDFSRTHPDFDVALNSCGGHVAGNVLLTLGSADAPVFDEPSSAVTAFDLDGGTIEPDQPYAVEVTVLGSAMNSGSYWRPATIQVEIDGQVFEPFGDFDMPVDSSLSDHPEETGSVLAGSNPRKATLPGTFAAGTTVSVTGRSWQKPNNSYSGLQNSHWEPRYTADSSTTSQRYFALLDGDPVPSIDGFQDQASLADYIEDYVDTSSDTMDLGANQVIYLYELGTSNLSSSAADYQDIVVVISLASSASYFQSNGSTGNAQALTPSGFAVSTQWRERQGNPIAPHLYMEATAGGDDAVEMKNSPHSQDSPTIDTFDSSKGPYNPATAGPAPQFITSSTMPSVTVPGGLSYQEKYEKDGGNHTINSSFRCKDFVVGNNATIRISGNVIIVAEEKFNFHNQSNLEILNGSSLEIYALKDLKIENEAIVNVNTADPSKVTIYAMADGVEFYLQDESQVYAEIIAPKTELRIQNDSDFYGRFTGKDLHLSNGAGFHIDAGGGALVDICGDPIDDDDGAAGSKTTGCITSADTFAQWFDDYPGVNIADSHKITLVNDGTGIYVYNTDDFKPINDRLLGNDGDANNNFFTYSFEAEFTYDQCAEQFFEFQGSDDAWVFIDDDLAMDLGGVVAGTPQYVPVDRLGLTDGADYTLRFFYAQRQGQFSGFHIRTNIYLRTDSFTPTVSAGFD